MECRWIVYLFFLALPFVILLASVREEEKYIFYVYDLIDKTKREKRNKTKKTRTMTTQLPCIYDIPCYTYNLCFMSGSDFEQHALFSLFSVYRRVLYGDCCDIHTTCVMQSFNSVFISVQTENYVCVSNVS